jgi:hypothetical protein
MDMQTEDRYIITQDNTFPPLPFDVSLSLEHIFRFWDDKALYGTSSEQILAKSILDQVAHLPVLRSPIGDLQLVEVHGKVISLLLTAIFPDMLSETEAKSASLPFLPVLFNVSQKLKSIFAKAGP